MRIGFNLARDTDTIELLQKIKMKECSAELAIADRMQTNRFLLLDGCDDGGIFCITQCCCGQFSFRKLLSGL